MDSKYLSGRIRKPPNEVSNKPLQNKFTWTAPQTLCKAARGTCFGWSNSYTMKVRNLIHSSPVLHDSCHTSLFTSSIIMSMAAQSSPLLPPLSTIFLSLKQYSLICLKRKSLCYKGCERCHLIIFRTSYLLVSSTSFTLHNMFSKWKYLSKASLEIESLQNNKIIECSWSKTQPKN